MIDKNISPETRAAWIETCEALRKRNYSKCDIDCEDDIVIDCENCPADGRYNNGQDCGETKGGYFNYESNRPAIRAYFERTLKELRAMETKMTKEEALENKTVAEAMLQEYLKTVEVFRHKISEYQAIIDAPEVDPRVGKLFVCDGKVFLFDKIHYDSILAKDGRCFLISDSHAVTRNEMENMLYKKCCSNCGYNNKCGNTENILMVCSAWQPICS